MKIPMALASAVLLAGTLAACGGGDGDGGGGGGKDSDYCQDVKKAAKTFDSSTAADASQIDKAFAQIHTLAGKAPDDIKGDWKKLDDLISEIEQAFENAGLKLSDLAKIQQGDAPEGVDPSKLASLASEFQKLGSAEYTTAATNIDKHAKKVCKVTLKVS
jgi:phage-related minor tail protein